MRIKAILNKPFSQEEKNIFIKEYNRLRGYMVEETAEDIRALDYSEEEKAEQRREKFKSNFIEIPALNNSEVFDGGWYRKNPKGYQSAVESLNTAFNIVSVLGMLPEKTLTFYTAPNFIKEEECSEDWLINHTFFNKQMDLEEFGEFYANFISIWNSEQHNMKKNSEENI